MTLRAATGFFIVCGFVACNLFEPRDAEAPTVSGVQYLQQTSANNVIENLKLAIAQKDPVGYVACMTDSTRSRYKFRFTASSDARLYPSVLFNWTYEQERSYFNNLSAHARQANRFAALRLSGNTNPVGVTNDSVTYDYDYSLTFELVDTTLTAEGKLLFTVVNDNSVWTIARWTDVKRGELPSWSTLKGRFSN